MLSNTDLSGTGKGKGGPVAFSDAGVRSGDLSCKELSGTACQDGYSLWKLGERILNVWRRFSTQVFRVVPPFVAAYVIYSWGTEEFERLKRKNPADYENDE
ncbi:cytochrome b-c1 complex subunit 8 [Podarcis lilfordi]|uniref:Cytochrome b-c1 complex subunit 8 n=1 Tax=Podarcis lilfordi TaxID=74358 RepID=A0AA35LL95_9SAUR|nr:cytochrome b-c1 complex subunit 8 [Podarcis lilfordi]